MVNFSYIWIHQLRVSRLTSEDEADMKRAMNNKILWQYTEITSTEFSLRFQIEYTNTGLELLSMYYYYYNRLQYECISIC